MGLPSNINGKPAFTSGGKVGPRGGAGAPPNTAWAISKGTLKPSEKNSPASDLNNTDPHASMLKYPEDLGSVDSVNKHILEIVVYKQIQSTLNKGNIKYNSDQWKQEAGFDKNNKIDVTTGYDVKAGQIGVDAVGSSTVKSVTNGVVKGGQVVTGHAAATVDVSRKTVKDPVAYIHLFMPDMVVYDYRHDFDPVSVTDALGSAGLLDQSKTGTGELSGAAASATGIMGDKIKDVSIFSNGYALNPQLEILYSKTKNREFRYEFKFSPRSKKEADSIDSIIRTLRYHAAPEYSAAVGSRYFVPPSEFRLNFLMGGYPNEKLPRIGQCVLSEINVDYASSGHYSTFWDGTPIEIKMTLLFVETVVLTKQDIDIGY